MQLNGGLCDWHKILNRAYRKHISSLQFGGHQNQPGRIFDHGPMRNLKMIAFGGILVLLSGCKKIDALTKFNMEFNETVVVPASTGINLPFNVLAPDVETNSESTFAINDTRKDLIEEIKLTALDLTLTSPATEDFGFLKSISVFLSAEGLSEIKVAWKEVVPDNAGKTLILDITDSDLKEYIKKDKFSLRLNTVTDEFLTSDYHIKVHSVFFVDAKVLGQ